MGEVSLAVFEERLNSSECSSHLREIVATLRHAAERSDSRDWSIRAHSKPGGGWGLTYKRGSKRFFRIDPKAQKDHVWASLPDSDQTRAALVGAGLAVSPRVDELWVTVKDLHGARVIEQWIPRA